MNEPIRSSHLHTLDFEGLTKDAISKDYEIALSREYLTRSISETTPKAVL